MSNQETLAHEAPPGLTVVQHHHTVAPRPLLASEANTKEVTGLEPRAFRRALRVLEVPTIQTPDGVACLVADLEKAMRERGRPLPVSEPKKAAPVEEEDELLLRRAGVRLGGAR